MPARCLALGYLPLYVRFVGQLEVEAAAGPAKHVMVGPAAMKGGQ
jgi:hypothetical protein